MTLKAIEKIEKIDLEAKFSITEFFARVLGLRTLKENV